MSPLPPAPPRPDLGDFAGAADLHAERRQRNAPTIGAIVHTGNHWHNRFLRLRHVRWSAAIHCTPEVTGRVVRVPIGEGTCLVHFSYDDLHRTSRSMSAAASRSTPAALAAGDDDRLLHAAVDAYVPLHDACEGHLRHARNAASEAVGLDGLPALVGRLAPARA